MECSRERRHRYTTDSATKRHMLDLGYVAEEFGQLTENVRFVPEECGGVPEKR